MRRLSSRGQGWHLTRISWIRTTPEGWQQAIKRMVRLNGLTLSPVEAKDILPLPATYHGLAPEEAAPTAWYYEKRMPEAEVIPVEELREGCAGCLHWQGRKAGSVRIMNGRNW